MKFRAKEMLKINVCVEKINLNLLLKTLYDFKIIEFFKVEDGRFEKEDGEEDNKKLEKISKEILEIKSYLKFLQGVLKNRDGEILEFVEIKNIYEKNKKLSYEKLKNKFDGVSKKTLLKLKRQKYEFEKNYHIIKSKNKFLTSQNFSILTGYIEKDNLEKLKDSLIVNFSNNFELEILKVEKDENIPIKLQNKNIISNFEGLLKLYSLPNYKEFDPTFLMFLSFPIFFGFILGDFLYGLLSFIFFIFLKYKIPKLKNMLNIAIISSISSMIFGWIYGEFLGFEPHHILNLSFGTHYGWFSRIHHPDQLLAIALIFGLIHINISYLVGFFNELKYSKKTAICDKLSWIIFQIGVGLIVLSKTYVLSNTLFYLGVLITLFSVYLIYLGHGFIGVIEIPGFFTNVLSYARLMAIGISSVVIAILINDYSQIFFLSGPIGIFFGILLFTIGHIFNIALGNFESFLQSLRLQYVESFSKFYKGGGKEFNPFGKKDE